MRIQNIDGSKTENKIKKKKKSPIKMEAERLRKKDART